MKLYSFMRGKGNVKGANSKWDVASDNNCGQKTMILVKSRAYSQSTGKESNERGNKSQKGLIKGP
jgi:hypothetical protein